jgi:hypothetical protein
MKSLENVPARISRELLDLNAQLESMGGGDAKLAPLSVIVRVRPPKAPSQGSDSCIALDGDIVRLVDPRAADPTLLESAQRTYRVSIALPMHSNQLDTYSTVGNQALDCLWDGFNASGINNIRVLCVFSHPRYIDID